MRSTSLPLVICLFLAAVSSADYVIWDYDMTYCPPGWYVDSWSFGTDGAHSMVAASYSNPYDYGQMHSGTGDAPILAGCDSIVIDATKELHLVSNWLGIVGAGISYRIDGGDWISLWDAPGGSSVNYEDTSPIHYAIPVSPPCTIGFRFWSSANRVDTMQGNAWVTWFLADLTLTACGLLPGLDQDTWGGIKALF